MLRRRDDKVALIQASESKNLVRVTPCYPRRSAVQRARSLPDAISPQSVATLFVQRPRSAHSFPFLGTTLSNLLLPLYPTAEPTPALPDPPYRRVTYRELYDLTARVVDALRAEGIKPGDRVASYSSNCIVSRGGYSRRRTDGMLIDGLPRLPIP